MNYIFLALFLVLVHGMGDCRGCTASANDSPDIGASIVTGFGLGKNVITNQFTGESRSFERAAFAGLAVNYGPVFLMPEAGYMLATGEGRNSSPWAGVMLGLMAETDIGLSVMIGAGPVYLFNPDNTVLSGHLQYNLKAAILFGKRVRIGISLVEHLSSCYGCPLIGGKGPNMGTDTPGVMVLWRL